MTQNPVTCVLVDDHPAILDSVGRYLGANGIEVVGQAQSAAEALALLLSKQPTVALFDLAMPGVGGIELMRAASSSLRETAVIVYTGSSDAALLTEALD